MFQKFQIILVINAWLATLNICDTAILPDDINWTNKLELANGFEVKWLSTDKEYVTFEMKALATGWVSIGFSPNGTMSGADIVIGWICKGGNPHIKDLYGVGNAMPVEDSAQDVELLGGEALDGVSNIRFRRKWNTGDGNDYALGAETVSLIWAFGKQEPMGKVFNPIYHGAEGRGSASVKF